MGNYDDLVDIESIEDNIDYFCITNNENIIKKFNTRWNFILIPETKMSNVEANRFYKIMPHLIFPQYDASIYIDGNIRIKSSPFEIFHSVCSDRPIAIYEHYERDSIYQEMQACAELGLESVFKLLTYYKRINHLGYSSKNLYEANIIVRKHNTPILIQAMEFWWKQFSKGPKRDQISFPSSLEKFSIEPINLGKSDARFKKFYFERVPHSTYRPKKFSVRAISKFNRIIMRLIRFSFYLEKSHSPKDS